MYLINILFGHIERRYALSKTPSYCPWDERHQNGTSVTSSKIQVFLSNGLYLTSQSTQGRRLDGFPNELASCNAWRPLLFSVKLVKAIFLVALIFSVFDLQPTCKLLNTFFRPTLELEGIGHARILTFRSESALEFCGAVDKVPPLIRDHVREDRLRIADNGIHVEAVVRPGSNSHGARNVVVACLTRYLHSYRWH